MKRLWWIACLGIVVITVVTLFYEHLHRTGETKNLKHVSNSFEFEINASFDKAFPLFGADKERAWAPGWTPQFIHPSPAEDVHGAVFLVNHGHHKSIWVNTTFDQANGHVQYVYVIPDMLVTLIDIHLTPLENGHTHAEVTYERTALSSDANDLVVQHGHADTKSGPEWQEQINLYLQKRN